MERHGSTPRADDRRASIAGVAEQFRLPGKIGRSRTPPASSADQLCAAGLLALVAGEQRASPCEPDHG